MIFLSTFHFFSVVSNKKNFVNSNLLCDSLLLPLFITDSQYYVENKVIVLMGKIGGGALT